MTDETPVKKISRRRFLNRVAQGLVATNLVAPLVKGAQSQVVAPDPPGKKLGWAIVGLGNPSIHQIFQPLRNARNRRSRPS